MPSTNQMVRAIAAKLTCDTAVKSHLGGKIQQVMIADMEQFLKLVGPVKRKEVRKGDGKPLHVSGRDGGGTRKPRRLAEKLGLI